MSGGLERVHAALRSLATRGKVSATAVLAQARALIQMTGLADEVRNGIELMQPYGMSSRPVAGGDVLLIQIGGSRDHCVAVHVDDPSLRIADLQAGEFGFRDQNGQQVVFRQDRIEVTTPLKLVANVTGECDVTASAKIKLTAPEINIHCPVSGGVSKLTLDANGTGWVIDGVAETITTYSNGGTGNPSMPPEVPT